MLRRYTHLDTDLDGLYEGILKDLRDNEKLKVVNELKNKINGRLFRSMTAVRQSVPKDFAGVIREVSITIIGEPDDFMLETHVGFWGGPGIVTALRKRIGAIGYRRQLFRRIRELVQANSRNKLALENVEYLDYLPVYSLGTEDQNE